MDTTVHLPGLLRVLSPHRRALLNAEEAVRAAQAAQAERHEVAVVQARLLGTAGWCPLGRRPAPGHAVQFADDADLVQRLAAFVVEGLAVGETCLVVATPAHRAGLRARLRAAGVPRDGLVEHDAAALLARLLRDGRPDPALFEEHVGSLLRAAGRVRAFGDMVGLLHDRGDLAGALALERLWDGLQAELGFPLLCGYPQAAGAHDALRDVHSHLVA